MLFADLFKKHKSHPLSEKDLRWNRFIEEICENNDLSDLDGVRRTAWLCFWYDSEINNGGHLGFFDNYNQIDKNELARAIAAVGSDEIAENFLAAASCEDEEKYTEYDEKYFSFSPALIDLLMNYVEKHRDEIL